MNDKKTDKDFEDYLKGSSSLSGQYRHSASMQPPDRLDRKILSAAQRAVETSRYSRFSSKLKQYYVPLSMAAVLVLCVSVVFNVYKETGQNTLLTPAPEYNGLDQITPAKQIEVEGKGTYGKTEEPIGESAIPVESQPKGGQILPQSSVEAGASPPEVKELEIEFYDHMPVELKEQAQDQMQDMQKKQKHSEALHREEVEVPIDVPSETMKQSVEETRTKLQGDQQEIEDDPGIQYNIITPRDDMMADEIPGDAPGIDKSTPQAWLKEISNLWENGEQQEARLQLKRFMQAYPEIEMSQIESYLGKETLQVLLN